MGLFDKFKKTHSELEGYVARIESNMANNYKDAAQDAYKSLIAAFEELCAKGELNEKQIARYDDVIKSYSTRLKGYTHKDQTPYWTK